MSFVRRILGLIIILISLSAVAVAVAGVVFGRMAIDQLGNGLDGTVGLAGESLGTVVETLEFAKSAVGDVNTGLDTAVQSAADAAGVIIDTQPLLRDVTTIASEDIPNSLDALQETIPTLVSVGGDVDQALTVISDLDLNIQAPPFSIPPITFVGFQGVEFSGIDVSFDSFEYDPPVPLADSIETLGGTLEGVPENLRSLSGGLGTATDNLGLISDNILLISQDLDAINDRLTEVPGLLDQYIGQVQTVARSLISLEKTLPDQLRVLKLALTIAMTWFGLTQLAPLYIGGTLLLGGRDDDEPAAEPSAEPVVEPEPVVEIADRPTDAADSAE